MKQSVQMRTAKHREQDHKVAHRETPHSRQEVSVGIGRWGSFMSPATQPKCAFYTGGMGRVLLGM